MGGGAAALIAPVAGSLLMGRFGSAVLWASCGFVGLAAATGQLALGTLRRNQLGGAGAVKRDGRSGIQDA